MSVEPPVQTAETAVMPPKNKKEAKVLGALKDAVEDEMTTTQRPEQTLQAALLLAKALEGTLQESSPSKSKTQKPSPNKHKDNAS